MMNRSRLGCLTAIALILSTVAAAPTAISTTVLYEKQAHLFVSLPTTGAGVEEVTRSRVLSLPAGLALADFELKSLTPGGDFAVKFCRNPGNDLLNNCSTFDTPGDETGKVQGSYVSAIIYFTSGADSDYLFRITRP